MNETLHYSRAISKRHLGVFFVNFNTNSFTWAQMFYGVFAAIAEFMRNLQMHFDNLF